MSALAPEILHPWAFRGARSNKHPCTAQHPKRLQVTFNIIYNYITLMIIFLVMVSRLPDHSAPGSGLFASSQVTKSPVVHPFSIQPFNKLLFPQLLCFENDPFLCIPYFLASLPLPVSSHQSPAPKRCIIPPCEHPAERSRMPRSGLPHRKRDHHS